MLGRLAHYENITTKLCEASIGMFISFDCIIADSDTCDSWFHIEPISLPIIWFMYSFVFGVYDLQVQELGEMDTCRLRSCLVGGAASPRSGASRLECFQRACVGGAVDTLGSYGDFAFFSYS